MAGTVSLNGLVSGYDIQAIIDAFVNVGSANMRNMQSDLVEQRTRLNLFQDFNTLVDSMQGALEDIDTLAELTALTADSSNESVMSAEITGDTFPGTYEVFVNNLAVAETTTSQGFADIDDTVGTGDITINVGGAGDQVVTIDGDNNSLEGVANAINDQTSGVYAYVIDTGVGANPYKLMITAEDTGLDNAFTIDEGTTSLSWTETVAAEDADIDVNGENIQSATNTVAGVVPGVTMTLLGESASAANLTITRDLSGIQSNMQSFVNKYNAVMEFINDQSEFNEDSGAGVLSGDGTLRYIQRSLQQTIGSTFNVDNDIQSLSMIGIKTESDGSLSINETELQDALNENYSEVMDLFTAEDAVLDAVEAKLDIFLDSIDGTLKSKTNSLETIISTIEDDILDEQSRIDQLEERLIRQFANMESIMSTFNATESYLDALFEAQNNN